MDLSFHHGCVSARDNWFLYEYFFIILNIVDLILNIVDIADTIRKAPDAPLPQACHFRACRRTSKANIDFHPSGNIFLVVVNSSSFSEIIIGESVVQFTYGDQIPGLLKFRFPDSRNSFPQIEPLRTGRRSARTGPTSSHFIAFHTNLLFVCLFYIS